MQRKFIVDHPFTNNLKFIYLFTVKIQFCLNAEKVYCLPDIFLQSQVHSVRKFQC